MHPHRILLASLALAAGLFGVAAIHPQSRTDLLADVDGPLVTAAKQVESELAELRAELAQRVAADAATDRRLAALERALAEPEPTPTPVPPRTRPSPTPTDTTLRASWAIQMQDGAMVVGSAAATGDVIEAQVGPFRLRVIWEDLDGVPGPDPGRWTSILANSQAGRGVLRWQRMELRVNGEPAVVTGAGSMPPRWPIYRTSLTLDDMRLVPETWPEAPAEIRASALGQVQEARVEHVGPYTFFLPCVDGGCNSAGTGGRSTAPMHGGRRDWLVGCTEGLWYRLNEALDPRGIWLDDEHGEPYYPASDGLRYWWSPDAVEYAGQWSVNNKRPGWGWNETPTAWAYEAALFQRKTPDISHGGRFYKAWAAVASRLAIGRYIMREALLPEVERAYSMDPRVPGTLDQGSKLYNPMWFAIQQTATSPRFWNVTRAEAQMIELTTDAAIYEPERAKVLLTGFARLVLNVADSRGIVDFSCTGDAASAKVGCPATLWFQNAMNVVAWRRCADALDELGEPSLARRLRPVADRLANWWGVSPPYTAYVGGSHASAALLPAGSKKGNGTPQYVWATMPSTAPTWDAVLAATAKQKFGEPDADYLPAEVRGW